MTNLLFQNGFPFYSCICTFGFTEHSGYVVRISVSWFIG